MNNDNFCTNCGAEISPDDKSCSNCGKKLAKSKNIHISPNESKSSSSKHKPISNYADYEYKSYSPNFSSSDDVKNSEGPAPYSNRNEYVKIEGTTSLLKSFFNFDIIITTYILKALFAAITVIGLLAIPFSFLYAIFSRDFEVIILIIIIPLALLITRIYFELSICLLKLVENTSAIRDMLNNKK